MHTHRGWLVGFVLLGAVAGIDKAAGADKPNVILVMCDDMGWGDVGFNGNKVIRTPHLDAMAKTSIRFNRFYAGAPVCSPTRGSALTGRHPYRYGIYFANTGHMRKQEVTLAEALKTQGYATGHFGKWHLGTLTTKIKDANRGGPGGAKNFSPPQNNGFDVCFSTESKVPTYDPMRVPTQFKDGGNRGKGWDSLEPNEAYRHYGTRYWNENGDEVKDGLTGDDSKIIMDRALPFIERAVKSKTPFFAVIWFHTPHLPVVAGPLHRAPYAKFDVYKRNYYGCVTAMDEQVGRLRQSLRAWNVADNTLLTFCSDNGPEGSSKAPGSAGPFRGRKRSLYEGGVRVPGLLEWPAKIKSGRVTDIPAVTSDYFPTVLDILGFKMKGQPEPIDGVSLLPLIEGTMKRRPRPIGFQSRGTLTLSDNRFKIVMRGGGGAGRRRKKGKDGGADGSGGVELYDLLADPGESRNIAVKHPDVAAKMKAQLLAWKESCAKSDKGGDY